jgi:hypothetical protein
MIMRLKQERLEEAILLGLPQWLRAWTTTSSRCWRSPRCPNSILSMPNGKPRDHPLTDILVWKLPTFSPSIDALVVEIVGLAGTREREELGGLLWDAHRPLLPPLDSDLEKLEKQLHALRDRLRTQAIEKGWEIDPN